MVPMGLAEALGLAEADDDAVTVIADELANAVTPRHSVARKAEIRPASTELVDEADKHEIHPGPLADNTGQRQPRLLIPHVATAVATL